MTRCTIARSCQVVAKTNRQGIATLCREKCRDSRISAIRGQESRHSVGIAVALMVAGPYTLSRVRSQLGEGDATRRNVSSGVGPFVYQTSSARRTPSSLLQTAKLGTPNRAFSFFSNPCCSKRRLKADESAASAILACARYRSSASSEGVRHKNG